MNKRGRAVAITALPMATVRVSRPTVVATDWRTPALIIWPSWAGTKIRTTVTRATSVLAIIAIAATDRNAAAVAVDGLCTVICQGFRRKDPGYGACRNKSGYRRRTPL